MDIAMRQMNSAKLNKLEKIILKAYGDHLKTNRKKSWTKRLTDAGISYDTYHLDGYNQTESDSISICFSLGSLRIPAQIAERIIILGFLP